MAEQFHTKNALANLPDPQKGWAWELYIPNIAELKMDEMLVRCRTAAIPGRTFEVMESIFMGTKQFFPGKETTERTLTVQMEEFEDQRTYKQLQSWADTIFDYNPDSATAGRRKAPKKSGYSVNVSLQLYKANGEKMDKKIVFYNAWPNSISAPALDYNATDSVKFDVVFQYDYYKIV
jgi:hypothetical protein